jgi:hypothetical protein
MLDTDMVVDMADLILMLHQQLITVLQQMDSITQVIIQQLSIIIML